MKLAWKILATTLVTAICIYYALHGVDRAQVMAELRALPTAGVLIYLITLAFTHLFRSWRWEFLLRPLGIQGHEFC